jgi:hypothetical protein
LKRSRHSRPMQEHWSAMLINARGIADCSTNRAGKMKCLEALLLSGLTPVNLVDYVG